MADQTIPILPSRKHSSFVTSEPTEFCFFVHPASYPGEISRLPGFSASNWVTQRLDNGVAIEFGKQDAFPGEFLYSVIYYYENHWADIYLNQGAVRQDTSAIELPPSMLDEILAAQLLARRGGLMLHACGVQADPRTGFVFSGVSGAGKTTTARLWSQHSPARLMSDERLVVRKQKGEFFLYSTPWNSPEFAIARLSAPLTKLFFLRHAESNRVRRLGLTEAVSTLLPRAYLPTWDRVGMENTLQFLEELVRAAPCYEFGFTPDQRAIEFVQCLQDC
jgi:hypothetical protein